MFLAYAVESISCSSKFLSSIFKREFFEHSKSEFFYHLRLGLESSVNLLIWIEIRPLALNTARYCCTIKSFLCLSPLYLAWLCLSPLYLAWLSPSEMKEAIRSPTNSTRFKFIRGRAGAGCFPSQLAGSSRLLPQQGDLESTTLKSICSLKL